ncbi:response regulator [Flavobacterium sp.]
MFNKILVAEDIDTLNLAIGLTLEQLGITNVDNVKYCDDAVNKIKKAIVEKKPYDLFITDLSFEDDHRVTVIKSGVEAIEQIRKLQPELKIVVYSIEDKAHIIKNLIHEQKINAYVQKSRNSIDQLTSALEQLNTEDTCYLSPHIEKILKDNRNRPISKFDLLLLRYLSEGLSHDQMSAHLIQQGLKPNSKSAIEKRIADLKDQFKANNLVHLIAIAKDLGLA